MTTSPSPTADREVVITRVFKAPRALVFDAFTDPAHIGNWWGPNGFTTTTSSIEVKPGGKWIYVMHGPDGVNYPNWIRYQEVVRPDRLVYEHGGEALDTTVFFNAVITFADHADGTLLTMRSIFPTKEARDMVVQRFGAIEGGKQTLARFADHLDMAGTPAADRDLTTTRRIPAPAATVWKALTDPAIIATWWGPKGFTNTFSACDVRPGGDWKLTMHGPDGASYPNESSFAVLDPLKQWAIEHTSPPVFRLTMLLTAHGNETGIHWRQSFASADDCAKLRRICMPSNEQNLDRLTEAVAKLGR